MADKLLTMTFSLSNPFMIAPLRDAIRRFKPDLIHAHYIVRISQSTFAHTAAGIPRVITYHGYQFECPKGGLYRKSRQSLCKRKPLPCRIFRDRVTKHLEPVDRLIAISHFAQDRLIGAGHPAEKVRYIPNGVPNLRSRNPSPASPNHTFLYVGRFAHNKGIVDLISVFRRLPYPEARLVLVGDGPDRDRCEAASQGDSRIQFTGWQSPEQVAEHYRKARVVVVPSLWHEVMNTVICEAQSWSRPVIGTCVGGNSDLIIEGQSGYLCDPGDIDALHQRMDRLWNSDVLADRLGADGFAHVGRYSMQRHVESIVDLYRELGVTAGAIEA